MGIRNFLFSYRSFTPIPLAISLIYFSKPVYPYSSIGLALIFLGEYIRISSVRYAGGITRTTKVGAPSLCVAGPYSRTRNPLYLGNVVIYCGVAILAGGPFLFEMVLATFFFFIFQYWMIISLEEETLYSLFNIEYSNYCKNVPRLAPRLTPWKGGDKNNPLPLKKVINTEKRTLQNILIFIFIIYSKSYMDL